MEAKTADVQDRVVICMPKCSWILAIENKEPKMINWILGLSFNLLCLGWKLHPLGPQNLTTSGMKWMIAIILDSEWALACWYYQCSCKEMAVSWSDLAQSNGLVSTQVRGAKLKICHPFVFFSSHGLWVSRNSSSKGWESHHLWSIHASWQLVILAAKAFEASRLATGRFQPRDAPPCRPWGSYPGFESWTSHWMPWFVFNFRRTLGNTMER